MNERLKPDIEAEVWHTSNAFDKHQAKMVNPSGLTPLDVRVLVRPDPVEEKTAGGIILPGAHTEREQFAQCKATLIAAGVNAWAEAAANPAFTSPKPGARVLIAKYGGIMVDGADGEKYRILNDVDVTCVIEEG